MNHAKTYHFGKNWQQYLSGHFSEESLERSKESFTRFFGANLHGKTFLDVGCGSGVHSLVALMLGATRVVSFDVDEESVRATKSLAKSYEGDGVWEVYHGSQLDEAFLQSLGTFDVVYCWGVAHHTGDMWRALDLLDHPVAERGLLYVAIYNTVSGRFGSSWWRRIKETYARSSRPLQKILEWGYIVFNLTLLVLRGNNPVSYIRQYKKKRGMDFFVDLKDWLGGYPYEHATPAEIFHFYHKKGYALVNLKTTNHIGCNEFLFAKPPAS